MWKQILEAIGHNTSSRNRFVGRLKALSYRTAMTVPAQAWMTPKGQEFSLNFLTIFFILVDTLQQLHLYISIGLFALYSGVTLPLHRHIRSKVFHNQWALWWGPFTSVTPSPVEGVVCAGSERWTPPNAVVAFLRFWSSLQKCQYVLVFCLNLTNS